jgi:hypothetical protein
MENYAGLVKAILSPIITAVLTIAGIFLIRYKRKHQNKYMILRKWEVKSFDGSKEIYELTDDDVIKTLLEEKEQLTSIVKNRDEVILSLKKQIDHLTWGITVTTWFFVGIVMIWSLPRSAHSKLVKFFESLKSHKKSDISSEAKQE